MTAFFDAILVHISLAYSGFLLSAAAGIPLAILSLRFRRAEIMISFLTGVGQAIPTFVLVAFMVPMIGIGFIPSVVVIIVSTLMPIMRSTYAGISSVDPALISAAYGTGLTWYETVMKIRIPLSWHSIFAGLKFSSIIANAVAVITVFIGSGGLGVIVLKGLARFYMPEVLLGITPAIVTALAVDYLLSRLEEYVIPVPFKHLPRSGIREMVPRI